MFALSTSWNPWKELDDFRAEFNRLVDNGAKAVHRAYPSGPPVNLSQDGDGFLVTVDIPGIDPESLDLTVDAERVTISGEYPLDAGSEGETRFHRRERQHGTFERTIHLPSVVDSSNVEAHYSLGVLTVRLHRPADEKPRRVKIKTS